jgi:hypothetical protein
MTESQQVETRGGIAYANHDGVSLLGDLYTPAGAGRFPALIGVHGGGWQAGARSAFQYWGPYLAERGYAASSRPIPSASACSGPPPARTSPRSPRSAARARCSRALIRRIRMPRSAPR